MDGIERRLGPCEFYVRNFSDVPTLRGRTNVHLTGCDTILLDKNRTRARRVSAYLWKYWRTFHSCDAFVMAGGTYFHDRTTKSVALLAAICLMARMRRMKIFAMGVGVSTLRTRRARILLSVIARLSDTFAVRDQQSFRQVEGKGRRVLLAADLAFDLPIRHLQPRSESRIIGIALAGPAIEEDAGIRANLIPAIEAAIDRFVADGWSVRLLEMQCCELSEGNRIGDSDILAEIARGRAEWVTMVPMPRCDGAIAELYSGLHAVVGMRFHALVLAALYGVPFVGIAHDAKVEALCESFAMPCLTPHSLRAGEVVDAVVKVSGRQPSRDVTEMMTKAAATNFEPIVESFRRAQP